MSAKIVFFEVREDGLTDALQDALGLRRIAAPAGVQTLPLVGFAATKAGLVGGLALGESYFLIACMGHGDQSHFKVYDPRATIIFGIGFMSREVDRAIVHLLSCNCGIQLGSDLVANQNAKAFIGYRSYVIGPQDLTLAPYFVEETVAINQAIARGASSAEILQAANSAYDLARQRLDSDPKCQSFDLAVLDANHQALVGPWSDPKYGAI